MPKVAHLESSGWQPHNSFLRSRRLRHYNFSSILQCDNLWSYYATEKLVSLAQLIIEVDVQSSHISSSLHGRFFLKISAFLKVIGIINMSFWFSWYSLHDARDVVVSTNVRFSLRVHVVFALHIILVMSVFIEYLFSKVLYPFTLPQKSEKMWKHSVPSLCSPFSF
jgi:hypothetical protein